MKRCWACDLEPSPQELQSVVCDRCGGPLTNGPIFNDQISADSRSGGPVQSQTCAKSATPAHTTSRRLTGGSSLPRLLAVSGVIILLGGIGVILYVWVVVPL